MVSSWKYLAAFTLLCAVVLAAALNNNDSQENNVLEDSTSTAFFTSHSHHGDGLCHPLNENAQGSPQSQVYSHDSGVIAQLCPGIRVGSERYHVGNGFYFHRQRSSGGRTYLRCVGFRSSPPCNVRAAMNFDRSNFRVTSGMHNHGPDDHHERVVGLRNRLLEACQARPNVRIEVIYHEVCRSVQRDVSSRVSLLSMRPAMIRAQSEFRPNIPHSFEDLHSILENNPELRRTLDGEEDLYQGMVGIEGHRSVVFISSRVVDGLENIRHIFCDGTFYARPNSPNSSQLFTVVTVRDNHVIPILHALMESRTEEAYRSLFVFLRNFAPGFNPEYIMTDFEQAEQSALREAFPTARLAGCLWHYARAVCRNVRSQGLHAIVRDNDNARRIVRLCMAIPLAPPNRLQEALNSIIMEARRLRLDNEFLNFFQYIRNTWIIGVGNVLSVFGVRHRTNNAAECHHRNLNSRLVRRPNIWRFLEIIQEGEDIAWRDLGRVERGLAPSRQRRASSIMNDARVRSCSRQVMNEEMDILHFLETVSWHLDGTLRDSLAARQGEDRPPSPVRGPPPNVSASSVGPSSSTSSRGRRRNQRRSVPSARNAPRPRNLQQTSVRNSLSLQSQVSVSHQITNNILTDQSSGSINVNTSSNEPNQRRFEFDSDFEDNFSGLINNFEVDMAQNHENVVAFYGGRRINASEWYQSLIEDIDSEVDDPEVDISSRECGQENQPPSSGSRAPRRQRTSGVSNRARRSGSQCSDESNRGVSLRSHRSPDSQQVHLQRPIRADLRPQNFSDEEQLSDSEVNQPLRRWQECLICVSRVGNYAILRCGAFPICGFCINQWFFTMRREHCPHCRSAVDGWVRLTALM